MRMGREKTPVVTMPETSFEPGVALPVFTPEGATVAIVSTGTLLYNAYAAAAALTASGIVTSVTHFGTIKPLDTTMLQALATSHQMLVSIEEHQIAGGFGGAVAEYISEHCPITLLRIGVDDVFGQSGTPEELVAHYGMGVDAIVERITNAYEK